MRVIAGSARGRRLETVKDSDTRPTLDRVKESVFGILQFELAEAPVLDLFAGSGALGIEALSRGAASCVFADCRRACVEAVRANVDKLGFSARARIRTGDYIAVIDALEREGLRFKLVFLDPPYNSGFGVEAARRLIQKGMLLKGAVIVIEDQAAVQSSPGVFSVYDVRKYGDVYISLLKPDTRVESE